MTSSAPTNGRRENCRIDDWKRREVGRLKGLCAKKMLARVTPVSGTVPENKSTRTLFARQTEPWNWKLATYVIEITGCQHADPKMMNRFWLPSWSSCKHKREYHKWMNHLSPLMHHLIHFFFFFQNLYFKSNILFIFYGGKYGCSIKLCISVVKHHILIYV